MNRRDFIKLTGLGFLTLPLMGFRREPELRSVDIEVKGRLISSEIPKELEEQLIATINEAGNNQAHHIGEAHMKHDNDGISGNGMSGITGKQLFDLTGVKGDVYVPKFYGDYVESVKVTRIKGTEWGYY